MVCSVSNGVLDEYKMNVYCFASSTSQLRFTFIVHCNLKFKLFFLFQSILFRQHLFIIFHLINMAARFFKVAITMTQLLTSITAAPAPEIGNKATESVGLNFDFDKLLEPAELDAALSRYDPKDIGFSRTSLNTTKESGLSARTPQGFCGDSSFVCATSGGSPLILDCFYMYNVLMSRDEEWDLYSASGSRTIAWVGTCCFEATNHFILATAYIGGLDIADLTRDSINKCRSGDYIGASGVMFCPARIVPEICSVRPLLLSAPHLFTNIIHLFRLLGVSITADSDYFVTIIIKSHILYSIFKGNSSVISNLPQTKSELGPLCYIAISLSISVPVVIQVTLLFVPINARCSIY